MHQQGNASETNRVEDPSWRIVAAQRSRYTHLYFYIVDEELGPFAMRIGAYLQFYATYYLNGHDIIAPMLTAEGVPFRMKDNAFVKQYEKDNTFLRIETCSNNLKDFRQKKALEHLPEVAETLQAVLAAHQLTPKQYTRNQLAYDLRKLRAHGLIERPGNRYIYALSDYGRKAAAMLVIVRNRILRPIAGSLFVRSPKPSLKPNSKLQAQYRRTTRSFNDLIALLKAA